MAKFDNPITIPFSERGERVTIPDTSANELVNKTTGFPTRYSMDPAVGGAYVQRETFNEAIYQTQASVKELQEKSVLSINGNMPDVNGNVIASWDNLPNKPDLGSLAYLDQVPDGSISTKQLGVSAVTNDKLANNAVSTAKIADAVVTHPKLANDSVDTNNIKNGSVTYDKLGSDIYAQPPTVGFIDVSLNSVTVNIASTPIGEIPKPFNATLLMSDDYFRVNLLSPAYYPIDFGVYILVPFVNVPYKKAGSTYSTYIHSVDIQYLVSRTTAISPKDYSKINNSTFFGLIDIDYTGSGSIITKTLAPTVVTLKQNKDYDTLLDVNLGLHGSISGTVNLQSAAISIHMFVTTNMEMARYYQFTSL